MRRRAKRGRMGLDVGAGQRCSPNDSLNPEQRGPDTYQVNVCSGTSSSTRNGLRAVGGVAVALGVALISIGSVAAASARASVQTFRFRWLRRHPASRAPCTGTSMPTAPGAAANRERLASPSRHRARWRGLGTGDDRRRVLDHHRHTRRCRAASRGQRTPELATPGRCPTTAGGGNRTLRSRPGGSPDEGCLGRCGADVRIATRFRSRRAHRSKHSTVMAGCATGAGRNRDR